MTRLILSVLVLLIQQAAAQRVVVLSVDQPSELGYAVTGNDTTIRKGDSVVLGSGLTVFGGSGDYTFSWAPAVTLDNPAIKNPLASPEDTTTYLLTVTDSNGCSFSMSFTVNVKREVVKSHLTAAPPLQAFLFPNPGKEECRIRITGPPCSQLELLVTDYSGRVLWQEFLRNFEGERTVNLPHRLPNGIYLVRIGSENYFITKDLIVR